jgi:hypothetical protein
MYQKTKEEIFCGVSSVRLLRRARMACSAALCLRGIIPRFLFDPFCQKYETLSLARFGYRAFRLQRGLLVQRNQNATHFPGNLEAVMLAKKRDGFSASIVFGGKARKFAVDDFHQF